MFVAKQRVFPYFVDGLKAGKSVSEAFKESFGKVTREIFDDQVGRRRGWSCGILRYCLL